MTPAKKAKGEEYNCFGCGKIIEMKGITGRIICPYCGSRILIKGRSGLPKKVKAR